MIKNLLSGLLHVLWILLLTLFTQIGGIIWLLVVGLSRWLRPRWPLRGLHWLLFAGLYLLATVVVIPLLARQSGRVPLPVWSNAHLKPHNIWFALLNRHYVRPGLRQALGEVAERMQVRFPGTVVWYMDANFPFFDGYPLEPHFSHKDGKKVDLSLYWTETGSGRPIRANPSPFGYGAYAGPLPGEYDYNAECLHQGYWYIGLDGDLAAPFFNRDDYTFDAARTRELLRLLAEHPAFRRILIQPHLKSRLGLSAYDALRVQGCKAARHDDHAHAELR